jgi:hypothetical protein
MSLNASSTSEKELGVRAHEKDVDEAAVTDDNRQEVKRSPWWRFGGRDYSFVSVDAGYPLSSSSASSSDTNLEAVSDVGNVWQNDVRSPWAPGISREPLPEPQTRSHNDVLQESKDLYKPIERYEGAHRFDPSLKWDPEEEKRLVRTVRASLRWFCCFAHSYVARLAHCLTSMHHVLCPSIGSW